jgi:hypothetical protein
VWWLQIAASVEGQLAEARAKVAAMEAARQQQEAEADSIRDKIRNLLIRRCEEGGLQTKQQNNNNLLVRIHGGSRAVLFASCKVHAAWCTGGMSADGGAAWGV